mgnify:CR=1 FL=1
MSPVICLVTDRRRFGLRWEAPLLDRVAAAAQAGVSLVQVRERDLDGRDLLALTTRVLDAVRGTATRVVVNERADVARAAGAHGVHLRGLSMDGDRVRSWSGRPWVIGRSVHDRDEAVADTRGGGLDYVLFGTVFDTVSKPGRLAAGVEALADVPPDFLQVLVLVDIGELSYAEAAQVLHVPVGTVMSRLHRARRILKQRMAERVVTA